MKRAPCNPWTLATIVWMALLAMLILLTAADYGDSWDEKVRADAGEIKLAYYEALLGGNFDQARDMVPRGDNYPGFHDLNLALLKRISPLSDHLTGNLFSATLGFLAVLGTILLGRHIGGPATGFWAGALLTLLPAFYGHLFINPKDIPFAFGYVWAVYFMYRWILSERDPAWGTVLLCGLAIGITMSCRIGGLVLLCYLALFIALRWLADLRSSQERAIAPALLGLLRLQIPRWIAVAGIGFFILLLYWPAGQLRPLSGTTQTLGNVTRFDWEMPVFFEGAFVSALDLPATYILQMILLKVPAITLLLFAASLVFLALDCRNKRASMRRLTGPALVLFSVLFPLFYVILRDSILYNGLRHLLFVLPPACALAASAVVRLYSNLQQHRPNLRAPVAFAFTIALALPAVSMVRLHPYQYIYYNELAGGTAAASVRYETDYWGTAYKELAEEFYDFLLRTKPSFSKPEVVVNMEHVTWLFAPFLPEETRLPIRVVRSRPDLDDYYAASTNWAADQFYEGQVVVAVERSAVTLGVVKDRRGLSPEERNIGVTGKHADED